MFFTFFCKKVRYLMKFGTIKSINGCLEIGIYFLLVSAYFKVLLLKYRFRVNDKLEVPNKSLNKNNDILNHQLDEAFSCLCCRLLNDKTSCFLIKSHTL